MSANTYGRQVIVPLTNKSGGSVAAGDVVVVDTTNNEAFTTSTAGAVTGGVGVAQETIASNAVGRVLMEGYAALVNVNASVTRGNFGKTYTVVKQATDAGASRTVGTFCQFLTGGTTPTARVYPPDVNAASGSVATDPIWTTAGQLAVATGSAAASALAIGNAGAVLARINGAVAWNAGTSFPTATTGDRYWRTDLGQEFYYDGTRWLSTVVHHLQMIWTLGTSTTAIGDLRETIAVTSNTFLRAATPSVLGGSNLYLVDYQITFQVNGGTALGASHNWIGTVLGVDTSNASTGTVATLTINSGSSSVFRSLNAAIGLVQAAGTLWYSVNWTKTGTPGTLQSADTLSYRIIAT